MRLSARPSVGSAWWQPARRPARAAEGAAMPFFISYSRRDEDVVKALTRGLEAAGVDVWRDHELHGGDSWWSVILERIRECSVFVFALSDTSLHRSKPCRAELEYAMLLRRPIVPVQ